MRLLVFGGTVFLSKAVAAEAVRRGHQVVCAARGASGAVPDGASLVRVDRDRAGAMEPLAGERFDAVVDVATMDPQWVRSALRTLGGQTGHWTFVSSMSVYADHSTPGQHASTAKLLPAVHERPPEPTPDAYGGAKVASEQAVAELFDGPAFVVRPGLIVGAGDPSDRYGYWPARLHRGGEVLVPEPLDAPVQLIDVVDLAAWILNAAEARLAGVFDAVCRPMPLSEVLACTAAGVPAHPSGPLSEVLARTAAGVPAHSSEVLAGTPAGVGAPAHSFVPASPSWLEEQGVQPWSGPRSLPLWVPGPAYAGFMAHEVSASFDAGLRVRPIEESAAAALEHERALGPDRERKAGLSAAEEAELLAAVPR